MLFLAFDRPGHGVATIHLGPYWARENIFATRHGGTLYVTVPGSFFFHGGENPATKPEPVNEQDCVTPLAMPRQGRTIVASVIDVAATVRANPWLRLRGGDDQGCFFQHLSPTDEARLTIVTSPLGDRDNFHLRRSPRAARLLGALPQSRGGGG